LQTQRRVWKRFQQYNVVNFVVSSCVVATLVLHLADAKKSVEVAGVHLRSVIQSPCIRTIPTESEQTRKRSSLSAHALQSATRLDAALDRERQHIQLSDANLAVLDTDQLCIPGNASQSDQITNVAYNMSIALRIPVIPTTLNHSGVHKRRASSVIHFVPRKRAMPLKHLPSVPRGFLDASGTNKPLVKSVLQTGTYNIFPYGECTWWADQRYHQLHGIFVPWRINANAFQWVARAVEFGWHVSGLPKVGSIMVLQPGVDGAYGSGHVGVVERVLQNGRVIASSMNWGSRPGTVTQSTYVLRPGVSFISSY
jgi:surface antigen